MLGVFCWSAFCCSSVWVGGRGGVAWSVGYLVGCASWVRVSDLALDSL